MYNINYSARDTLTQLLKKLQDSRGSEMYHYTEIIEPTPKIDAAFARQNKYRDEIDQKIQDIEKAICHASKTVDTIEVFCPYRIHQFIETELKSRQFNVVVIGINHETVKLRISW